MKIEYAADELLPLSGIQHFHFCRRQWALIHVERQWQENYLTMDGRIMHNRADDPFFTESRDGVIISRSMPVASYTLGLYGVCDVVEFHLDAEGVELFGREGKYKPLPIEYKRGKEKQDQSDLVQLCAQAICLEEMLSTHIPYGYLYYGQTRRRIEAELNTSLREKVSSMTQEMHTFFKRGYTPQVKISPACRSCSLKDICLPNMQKQEPSVKKYIQNHLEEK